MWANALLYVIVVLIWGSTWLSIKYQVNEVDALQAVLYRFALAACCFDATDYADL